MWNDALLMPDKTRAQEKSRGGDEPDGRDNREKFAGHARRIIEGHQFCAKQAKKRKESGMMRRGKRA